MAIPKRMASSASVQGSDEDYSLICLPCHRDEATVPAFCFCIDCQEHLCHTCYMHHKKATLLRQHKIQGKGAMPSVQQLTDTVVYGGPADNLTAPCQHHKKENIKLYCHDHKILLCSICVALEHTKPCHVVYIPDVSSKMINSSDYKHTIDRLDKLLKKCTTLQKEKSRDADKSNDSLNDVLQAVKAYRQEINQIIDKLQKEIEAMINALQHQNDEQLQSVEKKCGEIMKMGKIMCDNMKQLNATKQADQLFMEVKQAQKQLQSYEESISFLAKKNSTDEYKFIPNRAINDVLETKKMIGYISTKPGTRAGPFSQFNQLPPSAMTIKPIFLGEICINTSKDKEKSAISDMTVLPKDRLVLADYDNNSIKLVDVKSNSVVSQLSLGTECTGYEDYLCGITTTTSTQVAVTVPKRQHIQFISVSKKLSKSHTIDTNGDCWGICCYQDKLIVTYHCPGKLEILDMKGRVITSVTTDSTGKDVLDRPDFIQANSSSIYISDVRLKEVLMLNWTGEITGRIAYIAAPKGIALLSDGSLLVCDHHGDRVYQVSGCIASRIVLKDVGTPHGVYVNDKGHKLFFSTLNTDNEPDNRILVYKI